MTDPTGGAPDFELIRQMADNACDPVSAREAWGHFYVRHHQFLSRILVSVFGEAARRGWLDEAVQDSFMKAFHNASTFDCDEQVPPERQQKQARAWLARILENLLRDRFHGHQEVSLLNDGDVEDRCSASVSDVSDSDPPESDRLKLLKSGMTLLSEVERTILLSTALWTRTGEQHQRMPHEVMTELSRTTGKSPENVRQIRSRALKKLKQHINDRLEQ
jgi:RNA polymerase sigma factor (sigma-70 family)